MKVDTLLYTLSSLLPFVCISLCIPLQVNIIGRNGSTSCVGDTVTYTCTVAAIAHTWRIPSLSFVETITRNVPSFSSSEFDIITTSADATSITTQLSVISYPGLNGKNITCTDTNALPGEGEVREITAAVFGSEEEQCPSTSTGVSLQTVITGRNGTTSCVGDPVTYTCTINAIAHTWRISSFGVVAVTTRSFPMFSNDKFTIAITEDGGDANPIVTALAVTSFAELDGKNISCVDGNSPEGVGEAQVTTAKVFDGEESLNQCPNTSRSSPALYASVVGRIGSIPCEGEVITYTCNITALAHTWAIPSFGLLATVSRSVPAFNDSRFSIVTTMDDGNSLTTLLTVIAFVGLNGTNVTCSDTNARPGEGEVQQIVATVFGIPSPPTLSASPVLSNLTSLMFTIGPPVYAAPCVESYTVYQVQEDGNITSEVMVNSTNEDGNVTMSGYSLCTDTLTFYVVPITSIGPGQQSADFVLPPLNLTGPTVTTSNSGNRITVSWMVPITRLFTVSISRSDVGGDSCVESVAALSGPSSIEVPVSCGFARRRVRFCARVSSLECVSQVSTVLSPELPGLVELQQLTEKQSSTITLLVALSEGVTCSQGDQYQIHVDVSNETSLIASTVVSFSTQVVTHISIPAGMYACTTRVMEGGDMVDSTTIPCQSREFVTIEPVSSSSTLTTISASLSSLCVLTLLIGILAGCLATRMCLRRTGTAPIMGRHRDLNMVQISATAAGPMPMYEDMAPIAKPPVPMYEDMASIAKPPVHMYEDTVPIVPTAKPPVPMYEDIDDMNSTTFGNTMIMMEENEAYGHKITM